MRPVLVVSLAGLLLGVACGSAVPRPDAADALWASGRWPGTTVSDLEKGRELFVARCAGCHNLPLPASKTPDEWLGVVDEMATVARLSAADRDAVARYLGAASERSRRPGG